MNKGIIYFLIQSCRIYFIPFIYIYNISIEQVSFVDSKKIDKEMRKRKKRKQEKKNESILRLVIYEAESRPARNRARSFEESDR